VLLQSELVKKAKAKGAGAAMQQKQPSRWKHVLR